MQFLTVRGRLMELHHSSYRRLFVNIPTAALPTALHMLCSVLFSSALAIVVGADKYLLFPALAVKWVGGESGPLWDPAIVIEGSETQTSGILSSPLASWNHNMLVALHWDRSDGQSVGVRWRWRTGDGTNWGHGGKKRECFWKDEWRWENICWQIVPSFTENQQDSYRLIPTYIRDNQNNTYSVTFLSRYVNVGWTWPSITSFKCGDKSNKASVNKCNHIFGQRAASSWASALMSFQYTCDLLYGGLVFLRASGTQQIIKISKS